MLALASDSGGVATGSGCHERLLILFAQSIELLMQQGLLLLVLLRPVEEEVLVVRLLLFNSLVVLLELDALEEGLGPLQHLGEEPCLLFASCQVPILHVLHLGPVLVVAGCSVQQVLLGSDVRDVVAGKVKHAFMNVIYVPPVVRASELLHGSGIGALELMHGLVPKLRIAAAGLLGDAVWCIW